MLALRKRKRSAPLRWGGLVITPVALVFSLGICLLALAVAGQDPLTAMTVLWDGSFGASWALADALRKAGLPE